MKACLEFHKHNHIIYAVLAVLSAAAWVFVRFPVWALLLFLAVCFVLIHTEVELYEKLPWLWTTVLVTAGAFLTTFSIQYLLLDAENLAKTTATKWGLNLLCVMVVYLFVLMCSARPQISCVIASLALLLFGFVDYFVYMFRQNEFTYADIRAAGTGLSVAGNYSFTLTSQAVYVIFWEILYLIFVVKCKVDFQEKIPVRILSFLLCVLAGLPVWMDLDRYNTETWEQKGTYRNGYLFNFLLQIRDSFIREPEGYDTDVVRQLEEVYSGDGSSYDVEVDVKDPVIIMIMNESFADLTTIGDFSTNLPLTPFLDSLKEDTLRGYALSSVFGAKTPNSEWEYQTGNTMAFLPSGSVVYQQYLNDTPYSIVTALKREGYTCVAMHPYYDSGWSRNTVYPKLGYDETHFIEEFDQENIIRKYITDRELYNKIIERFENRNAGEKLYLMGITMQNHGGYTEQYDDFPEDYYKTGRSYTDVNQFLSLVHESDEAIGELISYFQSVEEPVEIIFFGDHQPSLNTRFYKMLNGKGLSGLTLEELENLYKVPFYIWTNYDTPEEEIPVTSLNYLSTFTLERAGIALPAYNQFLADLMERIPAINARGYYSKEYDMYRHLEDADGEEKEWLAQYEILQYNAMFDEKGRSDLFFPYWKE